MISEPSNEGQVQIHYRELAEHLPNSLLFILDRDLSIVFAGGSLLAKSRWDRTALIGKALAGIMPPAAFAQAEPHLCATLEGYAQSYELIYPTGEAFDVRTTPLPAGDAITHNILVAAVDITEKKRAELALAGSERLARATLDGLSAHIAIVDSAGVIVAVNQAWRNFAAANLPPDSPAGGSAGSLYEGANYAAVCRAAASAGCAEAQLWLDGMQALLAGATDLVEFEYPCHRPGEQRWFVARISAYQVTTPRDWWLPTRTLPSASSAKSPCAGARRRSSARRRWRTLVTGHGMCAATLSPGRTRQCAFLVSTPQRSTPICIK